MSAEALLMQSLALSGFNRPKSRNQALGRAIRLYQRSRFRGELSRLWARLTGRPRQLLELAAALSVSGAHSAYDAGTREVLIAQIRGSEMRSHDFDADFHPLRLHNRERWLNLATAWLMGLPLPPVALIQVGDVYFVRDGHHRISVARALGRVYVDARVTIYS